MLEYSTIDVRRADLVGEPLGLTTEEVKDILKENPYKDVDFVKEYFPDVKV